MIRLLFSFFFSLHLLPVFGQAGMPPLGGWREHLPYQGTIAVTAGNNTIFAATPYSLVSLNLASRELERWSKVNGLSETGINTIRYHEISGSLVIAYTNSNIDILENGRIYNIPDLERKMLSGDKSIYHIYPRNPFYYLSTGFGILVIDSEKKEVRDTWYIGHLGNPVKVNAFTAGAGYFFAATTEGLKRALINGPDPANYNSWQTIENGLGPGPVQQVLQGGQQLFLVKNDSLFNSTNGDEWSFFYADEWPVIHAEFSNAQLLVSQRKQDGDSRVLIINPNGEIQRVLQQPEVISFPKQAISYQNSYWVADLYGGLSRFHQPSGFEQVKINSPQEMASGQMIAQNGKLYVAAGSVNNAWNYQFNGNGIYTFENGEWKNYNRFNYNLPDSLLDIITLAIDPTDGSVWAGSYGGGLLNQNQDGSIQVYKQQSPIAETTGDPGSYRVAGLAFDQEKNLWIANFGAPQPLVLRKADGSWRSFNIPLPLNFNATAQIIIDDENQKWIQSPLGNGVMVFNHGADVDNTNDDAWSLYRSGEGRGNLPSNEVLSMAKDKNGFIWIGTSDGIGIVECPSLVFTQGCEAVRPVVQHGNFNGYLFQGHYVQDIAVDGANRKWIATRNGVWLVSENGEQLIHHFTEDNSPLLGNDVKRIAIDGSTGEVYFSTSKGLVSYMGTATEGAAVNEDLLVFPNPVPPGFTGNIAIRGLAENAIVKIIEPGGRLVYETRALGGQAIWNGRNYQGKQVASGVYIILVNDDGRQEKAAGKIFFIGK